LILFILYTMWPILGPAQELLTAMYTKNATMAKHVIRYGAYEPLTYRKERFHTERLSPLPMQKYHELILEEYNAFRAKHKIPTMRETSKIEAGIDPRNIWQELVPTTSPSTLASLAIMGKLHSSSSSSSSTSVLPSLDLSLVDPETRDLLTQHAGSIQTIKTETSLEDDLTALRFLRRAGFDPDAAIPIVDAMLLWREEAQIASLSPDSDGIADKLRSGLAHLHYFDRGLRPTIVIHMVCNARENTEASLATVTLMVEQALAHAPFPHRQLSVIADMRNTGMSNYDLGLFKAILGLLMDRYPGALIDQIEIFEWQLSAFAVFFEHQH